MTQRLLETFDQLFVFCAIGPDFPGRIIIVATRDDRGKLQAAQRFPVAPGLDACLNFGRTLA